MILGGAGYGGYNVLTKVSLSGGVDPFVFSTYRDGIGCITLFLSALYYERQHWRKMSLEVAGLILAMPFVGVYSQQALFLYELQYTDVVFASLVMNCIPVWAFLITAICGDWWHQGCACFCNAGQIIKVVHFLLRPTLRCNPFSPRSLASSSSEMRFSSEVGATSILSGLFLVVWGIQENLRLKTLSLQIPTRGKHCLDALKPTSLLVEPLLS